MSYRLAPQSPWPTGGEDIALAVKLVTDNIGSSGGDGSRVYLLGDSAGATHAASHFSHLDIYRLKDGEIKSAIMLSGLYDLTASALACPDGLFRQGALLD